MEPTRKSGPQDVAAYNLKQAMSLHEQRRCSPRPLPFGEICWNLVVFLSSTIALSSLMNTYLARAGVASSSKVTLRAAAQEPISYFVEGCVFEAV
jgi:hypothetical protein